jgi:hypothetical protein
MLGFATALISFCREFWSLVVFLMFGPPVRRARDFTPDPARAASAASLDVGEQRALERHAPSRHLEAATPDADGRWQDDVEEDDVSDSFLSQLEQRTQQVKITLANLETQKTRIERMIEQLHPLVPHYEALVEAERTLSVADIELEPAAAAPSPGWDAPQADAPAESYGWNSAT